MCVCVCVCVVVVGWGASYHLRYPWRVAENRAQRRVRRRRLLDTGMQAEVHGQGQRQGWSRDGPMTHRHPSPATPRLSIALLPAMPSA